jgi:hypothetical protein
MKAGGVLCPLIRQKADIRPLAEQVRKVPEADILVAVDEARRDIRMRLSA